MSFPQQNYNPPEVPASTQLRDFNGVKDKISNVVDYLNIKNKYDLDYQQQLQFNHNANGQGFGPDIPAATVISPKNNASIFVVTGTAAIQTILIPPGFNGALYLVARDGFSTITGGNIAQATTVPATALLVLCYVPQKSLFYVIVVTATIAPGSITTAMLAPGAASEGTPVVDNTLQNIAPYDTLVTVVSNTINVAAASDFVHLTGRVNSNFSNFQGIMSGDSGNAQLFRGAVLLDNAPLNLTLSSSTTLGGQASAAWDFYDSPLIGLTGGAHTYTIQLKIHNGSGNGTFSLTKTSASLLAIDLRAQ